MIALAIITMTGCTGSSTGYTMEMQAKIDSMQTELKKVSDENAMVEKNLIKFDTLDFVIFSNQYLDNVS